MLFNNLTHTRFFSWFARGVIAFVLLMTALAPVTNIFTTSPTLAVARAAGTCTPNGGGTATQVASAAQCTNGQYKENPPTAAPTSGTGSQDDSACLKGVLSSCVSSIVYVFAVWIPSQFAYVAGYLFNFGVQLGLNSASYALNFLSQGWAIVRDIANLAFIFILIYIAYTVIIGAETAGTMRALAAVIAMALLINFSFFLTRVVIDAGNLLAVQFYNAIPVSGPLVPSPIGGTVQPAVKDLTASIMDLTKVQTIMSDKSFQAFTQRSSGVGTFLTNLGVQTLVYISVGILITLLGFVFLLAGVKFLIRIVILWLAIIASPLAFAAHALPGNKTVNGYFRLWLTQLVQSAFYPAVFLFLFYIVTLFTTAMAGVNGLLPSVFQDSAITAAAAGGTGTAPLALATIIAGVAIRVGLVIVLVFYTMKFSDKFSSESSDAAQSVVSWASNRVAGAAGWTARNTAGRGANALARTTAMRNFAAESPLGRPVMASLKGIARSNLDVRGVSGLRSLAGTTGVTLDKPPAASFEKQVEARAQNIQDRAKEMKADSADYARADARYQNFKRNHAGGEEGFLREKRNLEVSKAMHEGLLASATNNKERLEAKADIDKIAKALRPYEDGRTRVKRLEEDRLNRFVQRIGEGNIYNVSNPSRGSIEGAARVRNTLKNENQTASVSAPTYKAAPMPHQNSTQPNPGKPGNTAGAHGSAPKTQAAKPAESHTDTDSTVELSEKTIKKLATALTNAVGHAQNKPITVVAANDNSRGTGPYSGGGALRAANDNDSHDTPAPAGGAMRASNDNSHDEGLKAA